MVPAYGTLYGAISALVRSPILPTFPFPGGYRNFDQRDHSHTANSVSGLVSKIRYRIPFDQSDPSISNIPPTDSPKIRPGYDF